MKQKELLIVISRYTGSELKSFKTLIYGFNWMKEYDSARGNLPAARNFLIPDILLNSVVIIFSIPVLLFTQT